MKSTDIKSGKSLQGSFAMRISPDCEYLLPNLNYQSIHNSFKRIKFICKIDPHKKKFKVINKI